MKSRLFYTFLLIVLVPVLAAAAGKGTWHSFDEGISLAAKQDKTILVDFYTNWCHWCKVMDEKTFQNETIAKKLKDRFVTVRLNAEDSQSYSNYQGVTYSNVELTRAFGITGYPSLAFLDSSGKPITIIPGFVPPEQFVDILDYIDKKCYAKDVSFEDFLKTKDCGDKAD